MTRWTTRISVYLVLLFNVFLVGAPGQEQPSSFPAASPILTPAAPAQTVPGLREAPAGTVPGTEESAEGHAARILRIGGGDLVLVKVFGVPELDQEARVGSTGEITLPLLGRVRLDGLTVEDAEKRIENLLVEGGFVKAPHVTIFVKEYATQGISVLGEVQHPGIFPLIGPRRLFDALSAAGGTTPRAGREVSITRRNQPDKPIIVKMNQDPTKSTTNNVDVFPGDTIVVSRAGVVYVVGDVAHPSGFVMDNNEHLSVLQAVALAGGTNGTAALNESKIIRKTPDGVKETPIPLRKILSAQAEDVALQPDDVVFVPNSKAKGAMRRSAEAVLSVATGLAIYRR